MIGTDTWLLRETKGVKLFDKFVLTLLKVVYVGARVLIRLAVGKKKRDKLYIDRGINFSDFLYNSVELLGLDKSLLIVFSVQSNNYKFCSRITRKVKNFLIHDVYTSMASHEQVVLKYFCPKEGDIIVDVGAAFGFYTILGSRLVGSKGKVIAIEAQADTFKMLIQNIRLNRLDNVLALNCAAYSFGTKLKLYGNYSLMQDRTVDRNQFTDVKAYTLDYLLLQFAQLKHANWIKIDVEGAELEVLKGATQILSDSEDIKLLVEIHSQAIYKMVKNFLNKNDFNIKHEIIYSHGQSHIIASKRH